MSKIHIEFRKGQRILIILKDGTKYIENKSGAIIVEKKGRIQLKTVRTTGIFRNGSI